MTVKSALSEALRTTTLDALSKKDAHDVIVVGAGAAGGLAAMLLAEGGFRVLVLDAGLPIPSGRLAGRLVRNIARRFSAPGGLNHVPPVLVPIARRALKLLGQRRQAIQSNCYAWELAPSAFVDDLDCPYVAASDRPFIWIRSRMLGGRLAVPGHGRQYYRFAPDDLSPPDGLSTPWPLRPVDLEAWYAFVERRLGLSGMHDHLPWLPDSQLASILGLTHSEAELSEKIKGRWHGARPIVGRYAPPLPALEAAAQTGRLQCRQGAVVREIHVDNGGRVNGVSWIDHVTGSLQRSQAPLVFLCASPLESTRLLMLSHSQQSQQGLGTTSGVLGRYLMDHVVVKAEGFSRKSVGHGWEEGRCLYLPRFDARESAEPEPARGFGVQVYELPAGESRSYFVAASFGEMLPRYENRVILDRDKRDAWGIPVLRIECAYGQEDLALGRRQRQALLEIAATADVELTELDEVPRPPGSAFHECGTARMGTDAGNSVLDANNECWDACGLYLTDASCFPSQGCQNPTLTVLALTARACQHALVTMGRKISSC